MVTTVKVLNNAGKTLTWKEPLDKPKCFTDNLLSRVLHKQPFLQRHGAGPVLRVRTRRIQSTKRNAVSIATTASSGETKEPGVVS